MSDEKVYVGLSHNLLWMIIFGIIGYFKYNSIDGALGMVLLTFILGFLAIVGLLPFIGQVIYAYVSYFHIIPMVLEFTHLEKTWVVDAIFGYNLLISIILSLGVIVILKK